MKTGRCRGVDFDIDVFGFVNVGVLDVGSLPFLHWSLLFLLLMSDTMCSMSEYKYELTLSESLAKKIAPLPTPNVPFFFFPFLSISETDQVLMSSAVALAEATRSAGST